MVQEETEMQPHTLTFMIQMQQLHRKAPNRTTLLRTTPKLSEPSSMHVVGRLDTFAF